MLGQADTEPTLIAGIDPAYLGVRAVEALVHRDYLNALGKTFRFKKVYGYRKNVQEAIKTGGKVLFRVTRTDPERLVDWSGGRIWIDPIWSLEVVSDPERLTAGLTDLWYQATSYRIGTGESDALM